jgi:tetratricopeptide (TPR) repeat protein
MIKMKLNEIKLNNSKWYIFPFLLLLLACPTEDDPPEPPAPGPEVYIQEGWADISAGSHEDALGNFDVALTLDPENIEATMGKAWSLLFLDSGNTLDLIKYLLEKGVSDSTWSADAYCGLSIVAFAQGNYTTAITYADILLSADPIYVFEYFSEIDFHDILLVKAQSQFLTQNYMDAYTTLSSISDVGLDPDQEESWVVNGISYPSFESALVALIALVTTEYDSGGFISYS